MQHIFGITVTIEKRCSGQRCGRDKSDNGEPIAVVRVSEKSRRSLQTPSLPSIMGSRIQIQAHRRLGYHQGVKKGSRSCICPPRASSSTFLKNSLASCQEIEIAPFNGFVSDLYSQGKGPIGQNSLSGHNF